MVSNRWKDGFELMEKWLRAGTTLVDDRLLTMKTVYTSAAGSTTINDEAGTGMIAGKSFNSYMQVRAGLQFDNMQGKEYNIDVWNDNEEEE